MATRKLISQYIYLVISKSTRDEMHIWWMKKERVAHAARQMRFVLQSSKGNLHFSMSNLCAEFHAWNCLSSSSVSFSLWRVIVFFFAFYLERLFLRVGKRNVRTAFLIELLKAGRSDPCGVSTVVSFSGWSTVRLHRHPSREEPKTGKKRKSIILYADHTCAKFMPNNMGTYT